MGKAPSAYGPSSAAPHVSYSASTTVSSASDGPSERFYGLSKPHYGASRGMSRGLKRVVVAGGGPAGLLAAHALLSRKKDDGSPLYEVKVVESREDPRLEMTGPRAYSLGLNIRGNSAINYFDKPARSSGLWSAIEEKGVASDSFWLHIGQNKFHLRKPRELGATEEEDAPPPTVLVPRNRLCAAMVDELERIYGDDNRLSIDFGSKVKDIDLSTRTCRVGTARQPYDLLVGADGVASEVRAALTAQAGVEMEAETLPGGYKVMLLQECPQNLDQHSVHAMESTKKHKAGFGLFLIPAPPASQGTQEAGRNSMCALVSWSDDTVPDVIEKGDAASIRKAIMSDFPQLGVLSFTEIDQLAAQRPSGAKLIRCNRYHDESGVVLLGDAAHSTGGTLGQGANSALLDVVALDKCLDAARDDISRAVSAFSAAQVKEGMALWALLQLKPKNLSFPWAPLYSLLQVWRGLRVAAANAVLSGLKRLPSSWPQKHKEGIVGRSAASLLSRLRKLPTQTALSQTLVPFSEIVRQNRFWVVKALKKFGREHLLYQEAIA